MQHENSGKEWSVDSFRTALENWVNPTKIVCASQKVEQGESNCNLRGVVECKICNDTGFKKVGETDKKITITRCECSM